MAGIYEAVSQTFRFTNLSFGAVLPDSDVNGAAGAAGKSAVDDRLIALLEDARDQFENGFPDLGIPPLEPLAIDNLLFPVYQKGVIKADVNFDDILIAGLQSFDIKSLNFKLVGLSLTFEFYIPEIIFTSQYRVNGKIASIIPFNPKGDARFEVKGLTVRGVANLGTNFGYLTLKTFKMQFNIEKIKIHFTSLLGNGIINRTLNWVLTRISMDVIQNQKDAIAEMASEMILEMANKYLEGITLGDIISG